MEQTIDFYAVAIHLHIEKGPSQYLNDYQSVLRGLKDSPNLDPANGLRFGLIR